MKFKNDQLIDKCQQGDLQAFKELYELHKDKIYNLAYRIHGNHEDAQDSVQDAFVIIYKKINSFRRDAAFSTWLYRIVVNKCLDNLRKMKKRRENKFSEVETNDFNITNFQNFSIQLVLEQEIQQLSAGYRTVFILYEIEGFSHEEIGQMLGISSGTSKSQLHRAKLVLKKRLAPYVDVISATLS